MTELSANGSEAKQPKSKVSFLDKEVSRRSVVKAMVGPAMIASGLLPASVINDSLTMIGQREERIWPKDNPELAFLNNEVYSGQKNLILFVPGFGDMHSKSEATTLAGTLPLDPDSLVGYFDYSNEGVNSIEELAELTNEAADLAQVASVSLVGRSMGGLYAIKLAALLGKPVKKLVFYSSPSSFDRAYLSQFSAFASKLPRNRAVATMAKFIARTVRDAQENGFDLERNLDAGLHNTFKGASPMAEQAELVTARSIALNEALADALKPALIPGYTKIYYVTTDRPRTDTVVDVRSSMSDMQKYFSGQMDIQVQKRLAPYSGHADVTASAKYTANIWSDL